ncbi:hypothetical protein SERLADRAFT_472893 [Serpula lacrymans var. lacrymans S7.9]|uniref:Uncharacterized protein n=1 Tax=Serpula lacrymans var. lacrymans (strain S7.9) TaxID=578457 RepID=F8P437_SERL9|nr:uncharacterized protein SERLADRAFT_472893 [Serpula lacrymans var. lacrymans S7.9]EGO22285.1 hypothetical protein SERLADRAFT_472893 [Serpula lacrymans var. lacrymans S7.9]
MRVCRGWRIRHIACRRDWGISGGSGGGRGLGVGNKGVVCETGGLVREGIVWGGCIGVVDGGVLLTGSIGVMRALEWAVLSILVQGGGVGGS